MSDHDEDRADWPWQWHDIAVAVLCVVTVIAGVLGVL